MSEFDEGVVIANPYAVGPANPMSMNEYSGHSSGNALAANDEARAVAQVKAQVIMARQFPRPPMEVADNILRECQRPSLADTAVFSFPRGKEMVTGPSIRLAEVLARNWGNNTFGVEVLERKQDSKGVGYSVIRVFAWDLQTNMCIERKFTLKHWRSTRSGGYALTDDRDIYELEANMGARRLRSCILQMIPGDLVAAAVAACRKTSSSGLSEKMKDPNSRQQLVSATIRVYSKIGIQQTDLEEYLNARVDDWTADHMLKLKELKTSLDDGAVNMADVFPHLSAPEGTTLITKEQVKQLMEAAKATGKQGEINDALHAAGIAKWADVPAARFDEVLKMVQSYGTANAAAEPAKIAETAQQTIVQTEKQTEAATKTKK